MASRLSEIYTKYIIGYNLSGIRREAAIRQFKLMLIIETLVIVAVVAFANLGYNTPYWFAFYVAMLLTGLILMFFAYRWRESGMQLWLDERRALKQQSANNLREIENFKETMGQKGHHNASRNQQ